MGRTLLLLLLLPNVLAPPSLTECEKYSGRDEGGGCRDYTVTGRGRTRGTRGEDLELRDEENGDDILPMNLREAAVAGFAAERSHG